MQFPSCFPFPNYSIFSIHYRYPSLLPTFLLLITVFILLLLLLLLLLLAHSLFSSQSAPPYTFSTHSIICSTILPFHSALFSTSRLPSSTPTLCLSSISPPRYSCPLLRPRRWSIPPRPPLSTLPLLRPTLPSFLPLKPQQHVRAPSNEASAFIPGCHPNSDNRVN